MNQFAERFGIFVAVTMLLPGTLYIPTASYAAVGGDFTVISQAKGDLNGDGRPDEARISANEESSNLEILLRGADGKLKKSAESATATMLRCGPSGGQPSVEIKKGVLHVNHYCGARQRYEYTHKYQWRKNKWLLIGYTAVSTDSNAANRFQKIDINFVTGEVQASYADQGPTTSSRFLEIRAPHIVAPRPGITDWSVPRIVLRPLTKTLPAVAAQAVYSDSKLFVRVQCDPPRKDFPKRLTLWTEDKKEIAPSSVETNPYGYILATFDLKSPSIKKAVAKVEDATSLTPHQVLRLTVQIEPEDKTQPPITTAAPQTGAILLSKSHEPLALTDINIEEGPMPHPFIYTLPE